MDILWPARAKAGASLAAWLGCEYITIFPTGQALKSHAVSVRALPACDFTAAASQSVAQLR